MRRVHVGGITYYDIYDWYAWGESVVYFTPHVEHSCPGRAVVPVLRTYFLLYLFA